MDRIIGKKHKTGRTLPVARLSRCQRKKARRRLSVLGRLAVANFNARIQHRSKLMQLRRNLLRLAPPCAADQCTADVRTSGAALVGSRQGPRLLCQRCARKAGMGII